MRYLAMIAFVAAACTTDATQAPADAGVDAAAMTTKVSCDGSLCDTSNSSQCNTGHDPTLAIGLLLAIAVIVRRRRRAAATALACMLALVSSRGASADGGKIAGADADEPAADVRLPKPPPPWRRVTIEWNPLPFVAGFGKLSANVVLVPIEHHALVLNPFVAFNTTAAIFVYDQMGTPMQLPEQKFTTLGIEIGYRHYWGVRGPRGFFVGPSVILASVHERQGMYGDGSHTSYGDLGAAFDVGYQMLVTNAIAISAGAGVQFLQTSTTIPKQQFPADIYANSGIWPRLLFSVGYAF